MLVLSQDFIDYMVLSQDWPLNEFNILFINQWLNYQRSLFRLVVVLKSLKQN